jgi:hypothetical protein
MPEPARAGTERAFRLGELEAKAEPGRPPQHQVIAVDLFRHGISEHAGVDQPNPVHGAADARLGSLPVLTFSRELSD